MDWDRYKQLCDRPSAFTRWMLMQSRELVEPGVAACLDAALTGPPLTKPDGHRGGVDTDVFELDLDPRTVTLVLTAVRRAHDHGIESSGTAGRGLGGFVEAWEEYDRFLDRVGC